jgi:hypothetical protein
LPPVVCKSHVIFILIVCSVCDGGSFNCYKIADCKFIYKLTCEISIWWIHFKYINVRLYRRGNQKWTSHRNW